MTLDTTSLCSPNVDEQQRQQSMQQFMATEQQYIRLLRHVDKKLKGKEQYMAFKDWLYATRVLEKVHQELYNKLDSSGQGKCFMDTMIEWGMTLEAPYASYIRAYTPVQKQHGTLLCTSTKTVIKTLPTTSPFSSIAGLLAAPFDQVQLYQSIYLTLLDSSNPSTQQQDTLKKIIQSIDSILQQRPSRMVDSASSNDLQAFQQFVDCDHVIDLFTKNQLDYQLRSRPGRIILQGDFLLLADNSDEPALRIHMVLTSDILMICKQMVESTGRYDLLYPPLAVNDITVQPLMLDRELIGEYTLEFTVLNKSLIVRAESREARNAWTGMPLTTTAKNALKTRVSLTNVVRESGNYNGNTTVNNNQSAISLNSTMNDRKSNIGALYGNTDISPAESSSEDDDDDDDDDDDSDDSNDTTNSNHHQRSLVNKKPLPSAQSKKISMAPPPKDMATPMINVSLHEDNQNNKQQRGPSSRAPLSNPAIESKPLPRSTSSRNRQTGSPSPSPRPAMPTSAQGPMMMMMQRPQQHQILHPQHSKQLPSPSPSSSSSRQHQHRSTSHGINGQQSHPSHHNSSSNRPRMMGSPQSQSSGRPNSSHQRPPAPSHHQFQQRPPYMNHPQQRPPQGHMSQHKSPQQHQQRSSQYHSQSQQRPPPHHHQQQAQHRASQQRPPQQRPLQQRPPQQRPPQHNQSHQRPPPHFQQQQQQQQQQQRSSPAPPQHHNANPKHPQSSTPAPANAFKPLPQTNPTASSSSIGPTAAIMARPDAAAALQQPMPPTPPPQKNQFAPSSSSPASSQEAPPQPHIPTASPNAQESCGPSLHLSPEELATPPRSPNPYNNQTNGIRQVLFRNQQCEVFRWKDESWYAVDGQCLLEVRQTFTNRSCVAIRVQTTGELYLNAWVLPQTQIRLASPTDVSLGLIMGSQPETYLVHFEQSTDATELNQVLQKMHHAAVLASRQPNDGQRTLRGEPPTEMMDGFGDDDGDDNDDNGDHDAMASTASAVSATMNGNRRSSSFMQSGQESTAIPQTLQPAMKCKCKLFVQNEHSNWSSFGSVQLVVSLQVPSRRMHIQIDNDKKRGFSKIIPTGSTSPSGSPSPSSTSLPSSLSPNGDNGTDTNATAGTTTSANTLVSATVYSNNVERLGSKRISFLLVNEQERTSSMVYMVQLREEESGNTLFDYLKVKNSQNGW